MSTAAERAADRIRRFGQRRPEALRLARYASLAVRLDAQLLRALRLELMPQSDAGAEADLWFSSLTESMSSQGFVFDAHVAEQLQRELATEFVDGEQKALNRAAELTALAHGDWPVSLQFEERITWLALKRTEGPAAVAARKTEIEALLRQLVKAMAQDEMRGVEVARWVQRALRRLPQVARETESALLLALGAAERLGGNVRFSEVVPTSLPQDAAWILPARQFSNWTTIGLRRYLTGIEFLEPEGAPMTVTLPRTNPLYLQMSWLEGSKQVTQTISVAAGRTVAIPATATEVRLRTLAGEELALESAPQPTIESPREQVVGEDHLQRAVVRVEFVDPRRARFEIERMGFFVAPDLVVSVLDRGDLPSGEDLSGNECRIVLPGGDRIPAHVVTSGELPKTVVLRLAREVSDATVLPRSSEVAVSVGMHWQTVRPSELRSDVISGVVLDPDSYVADKLGNLRKDMIRLAVSRDKMDLDLDMLGAPVIIDGNIVAQITVCDDSGSRECFAQPIAAIEQLLLLHGTPRPTEENPRIFISYAPREHGGGESRDAEVMERISYTMQVAHLRPLFDVELPLRSPSEADYVAAVKASRGGALLLTPLSHTATSVVEVELPLLAYWRWVKPDFPVVIFRSGAPVSQQKSLATAVGADVPLPANLRDVAIIDLDGARDLDLAQFVHRHFDFIRPPHDEASGLDLVRKQIAMLISGHATREGGEMAMQVAEEHSVQLLMSRGMFADIAWQPLLAQLEPPAAVELIDVAAAFSLPVETHRPLLYAAVGNSGARIFCINAMSENVARALLHRAWVGRVVPRSIDLTNVRWSTPTVRDVVTHVSKTVAEALGCDYQLARWLVGNAEAPLILIFATRPLPSQQYIDELLAALPHAIMLFLRGDDPDPPPPPVVELQGLKEGDHERFVTRYKELMAMVTPPAESMVTPRPSSSPRKASRPKKPSTTKQEKEKYAVSVKGGKRKGGPAARAQRRLTKRRALKKK